VKEPNSKRLTEAIQLLERYSQSEKHKADIAERRERRASFTKLFEEPFSEFQFAQVIRQLWAAQLWQNREYLVSQIVNANGIDRVRNEQALLSGQGSPGQRYERFVTSVKHMGPSMVTEILCLHEPQAAGIWNNIARQSLGCLYDGDPFFWKYRLTAKEYDTFNDLLRALGKRLPSLATGTETDLLAVDYSLWEIRELAVAAKDAKGNEPVSIPTAGRSRHNELRDKVVQIGTGLGFDAQPEVEVAPGSQVDVVWRARIGNLGSVAYVFEVQDKGSIDSLIVNLQQARATLGAKKLCVVSDREQSEKIQRRMETMPEDLRKNLS
jgi:hypothetical protein